MRTEGTPDFEDLFGTVDLTYTAPEAWSGDGIIRTNEQMKEWAEKCDCDFIQSTDRELFIDIDSDHQFAIFQHNINVFNKHWKGRIERITPSKQGLPHRHIVISLRDPQPLIVRIALQCCLGSDSLRELLSVRRAMDGEDNVSVFFEKRKKESGG